MKYLIESATSATTYARIEAKKIATSSYQLRLSSGSKVATTFMSSGSKW